MPAQKRENCNRREKALCPGKLRRSKRGNASRRKKKARDFVPEGVREKKGGEAEC